jgi:AraC-like DNA-binding protein
MVLDFSIYAPTYVSLTWALILLISSKANRARFFLGIFMLVVSMIFLSHVIYFYHLKEIYIYFDLIFIFGSLSIFPIYYWYIKLLTFRSKIDFEDMKLLIPAFVMLIATIFTYLFMPKELRDLYVNKYLYGNGNMEGAPILIKIQLLLCYLLQLIYFLQIIFSFLKVRIFITDYNENISNFYSNLEDKTLEWPKIILNSFIVTSVFSIFTSFAGRSFFDKWPIMLLIACIAYSVFLFFLGYLGYMQNHTIVILEQDTLILCENETIQINPKKIQIQLLKLFEKEQVFKNPDLKITDVAIKLYTNRTYISTLINTEYSCSFSTFVNQYRVEEAKKELQNEENDNFSLEHVSFLAGFGSLHSFIRVFKEITGTTPGRFREQHQLHHLTK